MADSRHDLLYGFAGRTPPVGGLLLGPTRFRRCERSVVGSSRSYDLPFEVDKHGAGTTCAYVNAE